MPPNEPPSPLGEFLAATPSVANQAAPQASASPKPEPELQTQQSASKQSPYQRRASAINRGDTKILLGQSDFVSTLNRGSSVTLDGKAQRSITSQIFLPMPSASGEPSDFPAPDGDAPPEENVQDALSKAHVRMLFFVFYAQKLCCELLGTLFLVTSIALAEKGSHGAFSPFSVSAVVFVLTFLFVPISGAHFNPAVSTAMFLTSKHFNIYSYLSYFLCQLIGGTCGALLGWAIMGEPLEILPLDPGASSARSIFHEAMPTILLIYTCLVLTFATNAGDVSIITIPLTASMAVLFGAIAGATMNPAVTTGIYMSHLIRGGSSVLTREVLIGILCPFMGALLSVFGFVLTHAYTHPIELRFIHFL